MYGIDLGIKYEKIYETAKFLREISGLNVRQNRPIFGDTIYDIESGIISAWYENVKDTAPLELSPFLPSLIGHNQSKIVMGKNSGIPSIDNWLRELNLTVESEEKKMEILLKVKEKAYIKAGLLSKEEFKEIVKEFSN